MESLLALSFSNVSSRDQSKIRKGLRQIEGLLAQICLSCTNDRHYSGKRTSSDRRELNRCQRLGELRRDPAFREFFRLQESFMWNVASRLLQTLERLMGTTGATTDSLILSVLDLLQGLLLLHPPSRSLFASEQAMNTLLDLLDSTCNPPDIQTQALVVLVMSMMNEPRNARCFENVDGLLTVTSLFKSSATAQHIKKKSLDFLHFYLLPEEPSKRSNSLHTPEKPKRKRERKLGVPALHVRTHSGEMEIDEDVSASKGETKSVEEKQKLLGKHLSNVAELVPDLSESGTFQMGAFAVG